MRKFFKNASKKPAQNNTTTETGVPEENKSEPATVGDASQSGFQTEQIESQMGELKEVSSCKKKFDIMEQLQRRMVLPSAHQVSLMET